MRKFLSENLGYVTSAEKELPKNNVRRSKGWRKNQERKSIHHHRGNPPFLPVDSEDAMGGWKKEGGGKPHEWHPSQKGVLDPPRTVRFPPPSRASALFFLYRNPRQSRPEALLEGSKNFRESVFSGTFSTPHTFCTPPYHGPIHRGGVYSFSLKIYKNNYKHFLGNNQTHPRSWNTPPPQKNYLRKKNPEEPWEPIPPKFGGWRFHPPNLGSERPETL